MPAGAPAATGRPAAPASAVQQELTAEVSNLRGSAQVRPAGQPDFKPLSDGSRLRAGDTIKTDEGSCTLTLGDQTTIDVGPGTTLQITEALRNSSTQTETAQLSLELGQMRAKLMKLKPDSKFEVTTPTAIAAVRGTTLYLTSGPIGGQDGSRLYVDETHGGVDFTNRRSNKKVRVLARSLAQALADGSLDKPRRLSAADREAFLKNWAFPGGPAQQFGIEEMPLARPGTPPGGGFEPPLPDSFLVDAMIDRRFTQITPGANGLPPPSVIGGPGFGPSEEPEEPTKNPPDNPPAGEKPLEERERDMIRAEIAALLGDQDYDQADANLAQISDAQTGKTFTDVHGNRVRVDQYVFLSDAQGEQAGSAVSLLSLTARTGAYQNGVSAVWFTTLFNRTIQESDGPLRDLPWNDYMNVVTDEQLTGSQSALPYDQFIVHEHHTDLETAPSLYPVAMTAVFGPSNAGSSTAGALVYGEGYTEPQLETFDQGSFWVQGLAAEMLALASPNGDTIASIRTPFGNTHSLNGNTEITFSERNEAQTAGLATNPLLTDLDTTAGMLALRDSAARPALIEEAYGGDRVLLGYFLPINDQGQVIDAPGFRVRGLRDLFSPRPQVNGGDYNLETLFIYGTDGPAGFTEHLRIDTVITPEIFSLYGLKNPDGSRRTDTIFEPVLDLQD